MGLEVEVRAVGDTLKLAKFTRGESESILNIHCSLGIVRELVFRVLIEAKVVWVDT